MALCKNPRCMAPLGEHHWLDGYCSRRCAQTWMTEDDAEACAPLMDPTDPTHQREICKNLDEVDAMLYMAEIDPRLPKIIYLRKRGKTLREVGREMNPQISHVAVINILNRAPDASIRACGLRPSATKKAD